MAIHKVSFLQVYSSSAGSGKTFTLAIEYLKIVLASQDPLVFQKVLAVTFTNDAAAEMSHRILYYLKILAFDDLTDERILKDKQLVMSQLNNYFKGEATLTETEIANRAKAVFFNILNDYNRFAISTIDSFVQRIIGAFAVQLGYNYGTDLVLDSNEVFVPMVENLFAQMADNESSELSQAIIEYAQDLIAQGKSWSNIPESMINFAKTTLNEKALSAIKRLSIIETADLWVIKSQINDFLQEIEWQLLPKIEAIVTFCEGLNLGVDDFQYKKTGFLGKFISLQKADTKDILAELGPRIKGFVENENYAAKDSPNKSIIESYSSKLTELFYDFDSTRQKYAAKYPILINVAKNMGNISLLKYFANELENIKKVDNKVHISDFPKAIYQVVANEPMPYIYERMGEKYEYIMIDEFQDTSPQQFHNFLPLLGHVLSKENGQVLLVGDPKQSIYRFRGGEMRLIVALYQQKLQDLAIADDNFINEHLQEIERYLSTENLNKNYRSKANIITFNNTFFDFLRNHPYLQKGTNLISSVYDDSFFQEVPIGAKIGGHVQFDFWEKQKSDNDFDAEQEEEWGTVQQNKILEIVTHAITRGYQPKDIAILCKKNKEAAEFATLLKQQQYPVQSSDALLLHNSKAVQFVFSFLKLFYQDHFSNRKVFLLKFFELKQNQNFAEINADTLAWANADKLQDFLNHLQDFGIIFEVSQCQKLNFFELLEHTISKFGLMEIEHEREFLLALLDVALKFKQNNLNQINVFFDFWEIEGKKTSLKVTDNNSITVTTIHKSKGLQYTIVIVPYLNWTLRGENKDQTWLNLSALNYPELQIKDKNVALEDTIIGVNSLKNLPEFEGLGETLVEQNKVELINVLYVATTRAVSELYLMGEYPKTTDNKGKLKKKDYDSNYTLGEIIIDFAKTAGSQVAENTFVVYNDLVQISNSNGIDKNKDVQLLSLENELDMKPEIKTGFLDLNLENLQKMDEGAEFGNSLHEILAKIKGETNVEQALTDYVNNNKIQANIQQKLELQMKQIVEHDLLESYFDEKAEVSVEAEFLLPTGQSFRADRIVFAKDKTVIIDYKTGLPQASHQKQIKGYEKILDQMGYQNLQCVLVYTHPFSVQLLN